MVVFLVIGGNMTDLALRCRSFSLLELKTIRSGSWLCCLVGMADRVCLGRLCTAGSDDVQPSVVCRNDAAAERITAEAPRSV